MRMWKAALRASVLVLVAAAPLRAQGSGRELEFSVSDEPRHDMRTFARPIPAADEVWIENMTALEVRDALAAGKVNVLIPTGSIEENGPWLTTAKHNNVLRVSAEAIARRMGDMLLAPIVPLEPGDPARNTTPGRLSLSAETYRGVLRDLANGLKAQGFKNVFFVGDSGGNTRASEAVAIELMAEWKGSGARAFYIPEYYDYDEIMVYQREQLGVDETRYQDRFHDNYYITTMIMVGSPEDVRFSERVAAGTASINGFSLMPLEKSLWHGRQLVEFRADETIAGIRKALAGVAAQQ